VPERSTVAEISAHVRWPRSHRISARASSSAGHATESHPMTSPRLSRANPRVRTNRQSGRMLSRRSPHFPSRASNTFLAVRMPSTATGQPP
jgi:hypothetical protein